MTDGNLHIGPLSLPTRTHHAEQNGCQVITATAMPEPVLIALAALVDALGQAFRAADDAERDADQAARRKPCRRHIGQYADYCGPCRSEQIGLEPDMTITPRVPDSARRTTTEGESNR